MIFGDSRLKAFSIHQCFILNPNCQARVKRRVRVGSSKTFA